jgi:hypothetical protein
MNKISSKPGDIATPIPAADKPNAPGRARGVQDNEASLRVKLIFWFVKRRLGRIPLSARIRARDAKLLELSERMSVYTTARGVVAPKLKELAQLKVAVMVGCPF